MSLPWKRKAATEDPIDAEVDGYSIEEPDRKRAKSTSTDSTAATVGSSSSSSSTSDDATMASSSGGQVQASDEGSSTNTGRERTRERIRDKEYYLEDGSCVVLIENVLFNVHRTMLSKDNSTFSTMFTLPQSGGQKQREGSSDECPIVLSGDTPDQFRHFLWALYALPSELTPLTTPSKSTTQSTTSSSSSNTEANLTRMIDIAQISNKYTFKSLETWALDAIHDFINTKPSPIITALPGYIALTSGGGISASGAGSVAVSAAGNGGQGVPQPIALLHTHTHALAPGPPSIPPPQLPHGHPPTHNPTSHAHPTSTAHALPSSTTSTLTTLPTHSNSNSPKAKPDHNAIPLTDPATTRLIHLLRLAHSCSHTKLLDTLIGLLKQLMNLSLRYAYLAMCLSDEMGLRGLRGAAYKEVMERDVVVLGRQGGPLSMAIPSTSTSSSAGEQTTDADAAADADAYDPYDPSHCGTLDAHSRLILTPSQHLRLLTGYRALTTHWETLRLTPPPFTHSPTCGASWHQHGCTQSWLEFWKDKTRAEGVMGVGLADVGGRLRAVVREFDRWGSATYMHHDCRLVARRVVAGMMREVEEGLGGFFEV